MVGHARILAQVESTFGFCIHLGRTAQTVEAVDDKHLMLLLARLHGTEHLAGEALSTIVEGSYLERINHVRHDVDGEAWLFYDDAIVEITVANAGIDDVATGYSIWFQWIIGGLPSEEHGVLPLSEADGKVIYRQGLHHETFSTLVGQEAENSFIKSAGHGELDVRIVSIDKIAKVLMRHGLDDGRDGLWHTRLAIVAVPDVAAVPCRDETCAKIAYQLCLHHICQVA